MIFLLSVCFLRTKYSVESSSAHRAAVFSTHNFKCVRRASGSWAKSIANAVGIFCFQWRQKPLDQSKQMWLLVLVLVICALAFCGSRTDLQSTAVRAFDGALEAFVAGPAGASGPSVRRRQIPQSVRVSVWDREFGAHARVGKCTVCRRPIDLFSFQAGHIVSQAAGGSDALNNLTPLCAACNQSMGAENLNEFRARYYER